MPPALILTAPQASNQSISLNMQTFTSVNRFLLTCSFKHEPPLSAIVIILGSSRVDAAIISIIKPET